MFVQFRCHNQLKDNQQFFQEMSQENCLLTAVNGLLIFIFRINQILFGC